MDFRELKELAKQLGGIVVMNGDSPELVLLPYGHYRRLVLPGVKPEENELNPADGQEIERLNREILALKEEIRQKEEAELANEENSGLEEGRAEAL